MKKITDWVFIVIQLIISLTTIKKQTKYHTTMSDQVEDKNGNTIDEGDRVFTKIRGGKREGEVNKHYFESLQSTVF